MIYRALLEEDFEKLPAVLRVFHSAPAPTPSCSRHSPTSSKRTAHEVSRRKSNACHHGNSLRCVPGEVGTPTRRNGRSVIRHSARQTTGSTTW